MKDNTLLTVLGMLAVTHNLRFSTGKEVIILIGTLAAGGAQIVIFSTGPKWPQKTKDYAA